MPAGEKTMKTRRFLSCSNKVIPISAFLLTTLAAILVTVEGLFWVYNQSLFAPRFDVIDLLLHFGSVVVLALSAVLLLRQPSHNKILGFAIGVSALTSIIGGGGFLAGFVMGIVGGVIAFTWKSNVRLISLINNRLMKLSRKNRAVAFLAVVIISILIVMPTELSYQLYITSIQQQTLSGSKLINTPNGLIEYADVGEG